MCHFLPVFREARGQTATRCQGCCRFGHYDHVQAWQFFTLEAKTFSDFSLDAIATYGRLTRLFRYSQPKPRAGSIVWPAQHGEVAIVGTGIALEDVAEFRGLAQS